MSFASTSFLFLFLPIAVGVYFLLPRKRGLRLRNLFLLGISYFFYAWGEPLFVLLLMALTVLTWLLGRMADGRGHTRTGNMAVTLAVVMNVGALAAFAKFSLSHVPLGFSFFAFHSIAYVVDIYRGRCKAAPKLIDAALYLTVFFKMLQGPIVPYWQFEPQIESRRTTRNDFSQGIWRLAVGLVKKMVVASNLAPLSRAIFASDFSTLSLSDAWTGCLVYMIVLYVDFSGYSDMAIGLARVFGFKMPENFDYPYMSTSVGEYWRRWHITMIAWFRDYLYYPIVLGPSVRFRKFLLRHRVNERAARTLQNFFVPMCVWLVTALWHGTNWNYTIWGLANCAALVAEPHLKPLGNPAVNKVVRWFGTLFLLMLFVPLVCTDSLASAAGYFKAMAGGTGCCALSGLVRYGLKARWLLLLVAILGSFRFYPWIKGKLCPASSPRIRAAWQLAETLGLMAAVVLAIGFLFRTGTLIFDYQQ